MPGTSNAALRVSIDNLLEGVQVIGYDWCYLYVNATATLHGRRTAADLLGKSLLACYPNLEQTAMYALLDRVMSSRRSERMLNEFHYADGTSRWFELSVEPVP